MWLTEIDKDKQDLYETFKVDDIVFYRLKENTPPVVVKKRRYSDTLKDPIYTQRNINRKLNLIKNFKNKNGDLPLLVERWKLLIEEAVVLLNREYEIKPSEIFNLFNLEKYGFKLEDYE